MEAVTGYRVKSIFELDNKPYINSLKDTKAKVDTTLTGISSKVRESSSLIKGALGIIGFVGVVNEFKKIDEAATNQRIAFKGLRSAAEAFGRDAKLMNTYAKELASDGLLKTKQAAEGLKFLMATGFNEKEAFNIGLAFKDVGAYNNVIGDLGQAFVDSSKGIKTGSIELIENIGLTQRLSSVLKSAGIDMKNGIDLTNNAAQRQAVYNSIMREGLKFKGDAADLANDPFGKQMALQNRIENVRAQLGTGLLPVKNEVLDFLVDGFEKMSDIIDRVDFGKIFNDDKLDKIKNITTGVLGIAGGLGLVLAAVTVLTSPIGLVVASAGLLYNAFDKNILGIKSLFSGLWNILDGIYVGMVKIYNKATAAVNAVALKGTEGNIKVINQEILKYDDKSSYGMNKSGIDKLIGSLALSADSLNSIKRMTDPYFNIMGGKNKQTIIGTKDTLTGYESKQVLTQILTELNNKKTSLIGAQDESSLGKDPTKISLGGTVKNILTDLENYGKDILGSSTEGLLKITEDVGGKIRTFASNVYSNFMKNPVVPVVPDANRGKNRTLVPNPIVSDEKKKDTRSDLEKLLDAGYKPAQIESVKDFGKVGGTLENKRSAEDFLGAKELILNRIKSFDSIDNLTKNVLSKWGANLLNPNVSLNGDGTYGKEHMKDYNEAYDKEITASLEKISTYVNRISDSITNALISGFDKGANTAKKYLDSDLVDYTSNLGKASVSATKELISGDKVGAIITIGAAVFSPFLEGITENLLIPLASVIGPFFSEIAPLMQSASSLLMPAIYSLRPLFSILGVALQILNPIVQIVGKGMMLFYDYAIRPVTNLIIGIIRGLGQMFQGLANVDVFGWHPFGFLANTGNALAGVDYLKKSDEYINPTNSEDKSQESQYSATSVSTVNNYNTITFTGTINSLGKDTKVMREIAENVLEIFTTDFKIDLVGGKA